MPHGDQPEGPRPDGLLPRVVGSDRAAVGRLAGAGVGYGFGVDAVGVLSVILGAVAHQHCQGDRRHQTDATHHQRGVLPAQASRDFRGGAGIPAHGPGHQGDDHHAAQSEAQHGYGHGGGAARSEPVVQGGVGREPGSQASAKAHHDERNVEHPEVGRAAEEDETGGEYQQADDDHLARAQLVHAPAGDGTHDGAFHAGEGEGPGELRGRPAEVLLQDGHPEGEGLEQRHRPDHHDHGADNRQPPPIEHAPHQPHRVGELTYLQQQGTPSLDYDNRTGERCFSQTSQDIILHPVLYWCFGVITGTNAAPDGGPHLQGYRETHSYPLGATCHCQRPRRPNSGSKVIPVSVTSVLPKRPTFCAFTCLMWQKRRTIAPIITRFPQKPPVQTLPARRHFRIAQTPTPSVPCYPAPQFQPATQARHSRPNAHFPTPLTSLPQIRSPARQYRLKPSPKPFTSAPNSAPPPAQCPTGISGNKRK